MCTAVSVKLYMSLATSHSEVQSTESLQIYGLYATMLGLLQIPIFKSKNTHLKLAKYSEISKILKNTQNTQKNAQNTQKYPIQ